MNKSYLVVLLTSVMVYAFRSLQFLFIGSYAPGILLSFFSLSILSGIYFGRKWTKSVIKTWAFLMILFGALRYAMIAMLYFENINEIHILEQFTVMFNVVNILSITAGTYLFRTVKKNLLLPV